MFLPTTQAPTSRKRRNRNEYQRQLMASRRAAQREVAIPPVVDPDRRARCLEDPELFLRTYFPRFFSRPFTAIQQKVLKSVHECMLYGSRQAIAIPRGDGKTKITEGMTVFGIVKGLIKFVVPISASKGLAANIAEDLKTMLQEPIFAEDFPEIAAPILALDGESRKATGQTVNGKRTKIIWIKKYIQLPTVAGSAASGAVIYPQSLDSAIRGMGIGELRPDFVILDDPETAKSARSAQQVATRERLINNDVAGLVGPDASLGIVALVTIQTSISLAARLTDRTIRPDFFGMRHGALEKWPDRMDLWEEYQHRRRAAQEAGDRYARDASNFYLANKDVMDAGASITNPHRFNTKLGDDGQPIEVSALQHCFNFISDFGLDSFACEYQQHPNDGSDQQEEAISSRLVESRTSRLERNTIPEGLIGITAAIDVGKWLGHWIILGFRPECRVSIIDYGTAESPNLTKASSDEAVERAVMLMLASWYDDVCSRTWTDTADRTLGIDFSFVDSGDGNLTKKVLYRFVRDRVGCVPKIAASKGYGQGQRKDPEDGKIKGTHRINGDYWFAELRPDQGIYLYHLDANYWKRFTHQRFLTIPFPDSEVAQVDDQNAFSIVLPEPRSKREHVGYAKHIVAERYRETWVAGKGMQRGWIPESQNNHWLDATYMALAAGCALGLYKVADVPAELVAELPTPVPINAAKKRPMNLLTRNSRPTFRRR